MKQLFYFTAPWCTHCVAMEPTIAQLQQRGIHVEKINIDYELDRAKQAGVQSIPTLVLAQNGQELKRISGIRTTEQIINFYNS